MLTLRRLRLALLLTVVWGCRRPLPPPRAAVVAPPVDRDAGGPAPVDVAPAEPAASTWSSLSATEPLAPGCFAWSPRLGVAACLVGQSGTNLNEDTVWSVRFSGEPESSALSLVPGPDAGWFDRPDQAATPPAVLARLRARLDADGFIDLGPHRRVLTAAALAWAPGMTVRAVRLDTFGGGSNAAARATDRIEVQWQPRAPGVALTAWEDRPVAEPQLRAYVIPGGRYLVLDAIGAYGDEGEYGVHARSWVCDREARACQ